MGFGQFLVGFFIRTVQCGISPMTLATDFSWKHLAFVPFFTSKICINKKKFQKSKKIMKILAIKAIFGVTNL